MCHGTEEDRMSYHDMPIDGSRSGASEMPGDGDGAQGLVARVGAALRRHLQTWPRRYVHQQIALYEDQP
jgi:hypothetical protein